MSFSDTEKSIIGKLFKKYKKEQNISIKIIEYSDISSTRTLYDAMKLNRRK